jgi:membrane associated rhomboid family serine protease
MMDYYGQRYQLGIIRKWGPAVKFLILTNIGIFILQEIAGGANAAILTYLGLTPDFFISHFALWQLVTYMFLHGGFGHLLINMLILYMFGVELEDHWGTREFVKYYFICGIGAGLLHLLISWGSPVPVVGASGAIYGLLAAFGILFPNRILTLLLFFILPIQIMAKYLVMIFVGISLFYGIFGGESRVAHFAHLGGMLVGFLYLKFDWRFNLVGNWLHRQSVNRRMRIERADRQRDEQLRDRVDAILDKINEVGYEKLTDEEKRILTQASRNLKSKSRVSDRHGEA